MRGQTEGTRKALPRRIAPSVTAMALVLAVAGCSQVPEWANPVGWVDGWFEDDGGSSASAPEQAAATPGADKPFPKLADTKAPQQSGSPAEQRQQLAKSLVADRDNARYTDQNLRPDATRLAAAPPPPAPTPVPKAKPTPPTMKRVGEGSAKLTAIPTTKGSAPLPRAPSLPAPPKVVRSDTSSSSLTKVPSIVQRRGSLPPPPSPVAEVSRKPIPRIVQSSPATQRSAQAALPKPPAAVQPTITPPATTMSSSPVAVPPAVPPAVPQLAGQPAVATPPSVQVNLPVGQDQSVLAQAFSASVAAQGTPVVRQPGNVFNAPNAQPIGGQWPTVVPGVVQQAFNSSLAGTQHSVPPAVGGQGTVVASPQMSNAAIGRLPGAPVLIRFGHGSSRLSAKEKQQLAQIAAQAKGSGRMVYVVGHASQRTGDMDYAKHKVVNFNVSLDRANRVASELRRRGLASEQIIVQAKGDEEPLYFEFMPNGEAKNRRVEVFVR